MYLSWVARKRYELASYLVGAIREPDQAAVFWR